MGKIKNIWRWLNGNKTIITGIIVGALQLSIVKENIDPKVYETALWASGTLYALSLGHHATKGYFSTKVGNPKQEIKNNDIPKTIQELKNIFLKSKK